MTSEEVRKEILRILGCNSTQEEEEVILDVIKEYGESQYQMGLDNGSNLLERI